jgi:hypothetical protein
MQAQHTTMFRCVEIMKLINLLRTVDTRELLKGQTEGLLKLPTDTALLDDPDFRPYVELYAKVMWAFVPTK